MERCEACGIGYCVDRVRRTYGRAVRRGYCSVKCSSAAEDARDLAVKAFNELWEEGLLTDDVAGDAIAFARVVKIISKWMMVADAK